MQTLLILVASIGFSLSLGCASKGTSADESDGAVDGCHTPLGFIPEGRTKTGYLRPIEQGGANCEQGQLTCNNGVWTGPYIHPSCTRLNN